MNAITKTTLKLKLTPQNREKTDTNISPILSKANNILFSFLEYFS